MVRSSMYAVRENTCPGAGTRVPFGRMKDVKRSGEKRQWRHDRPPGREADHDSRRAPRGSRAGPPAELSELAAEFPGYEFATQQTWDGMSIIARRHGSGARPGLYAVVVNDVDEMRRALLEQERPS